MTDNSRLLASRFLALAEEIFARADRVRDADIREKICAIAAGYERLAQLVEDESREGQRGAPHAGGRRLAPLGRNAPIHGRTAVVRPSRRRVRAHTQKGSLFPS
jgi:hypothetical protein